MRAMITENWQKCFFRENEKSLWHLLNNLATAFPLFSSERKRYIWQRCTVLIWLSCALPNRLLGVRMNSCDLPWLLTRGHSQDSAPWLPALSTSLSSSGMTWITTVTTSQASRAVASITGIHCDLNTLMQLHLHGTGFLERKINSLSAETASFQNIGKILPLMSNVCWTHLASAWKLPVNS